MSVGARTLSHALAPELFETEHEHQEADSNSIIQLHLEIELLSYYELETSYTAFAQSQLMPPELIRRDIAIRSYAQSRDRVPGFSSMFTNINSQLRHCDRTGIKG